MKIAKAQVWDVLCGILGIGIDTSIASAEEVETAIENQKKIDETKVEAIKRAIQVRQIPPHIVNAILHKYNYENIEDILVVDYKKVCDTFADYGN